MRASRRDRADKKLLIFHRVRFTVRQEATYNQRREARGRISFLDEKGDVRFFVFRRQIRKCN